MLVLSRKIGERIHIGEDIVVEVRRIAGNRVTLALRAPRDLRILRGELEMAAKEFADPSSEYDGAQSTTANRRSPALVVSTPLALTSTHESGTHVAM